MIQIGILLVLAVVGVLLFAKWHNSKSIDNLTRNLTHEKDFTKSDTDELIGTAKEADEALNQRVDENKEVVEQIKKDTATIEEYQTDVFPHTEEVDTGKEGGEDAVK